MNTLRTLVACSLALAAGLALAQDKTQPAAKPAAKAAVQKAGTDAPARRSAVDAGSVKPAATAESRDEAQRHYKSRDGSPCHHSKATDA